MKIHRTVLLILLAVFSSIPNSGWAQRVNYEEPPISYSNARPANRVSRLQEQLDAGQTTLQFDAKTGYLTSLLSALEIPVESQVLTFSRTSLQDDRISPRTPRAIYFSDEIHLGYVQQGLIEIAACDPSLGMVFYTLRQTAEQPPLFQRQTNSCLTCHGAARTKNVPGLLIRSVYPDPEGHPVVSAGSFLSTARSPLNQRWGGWYVTGTHGDQPHLGNFVLTTAKKPATIDNTAGHNVTDLSNRFDTTHYLTPHSDLVALMVLEHQTETLNILTTAAFEMRHAQYLLEQASDESAQTAAKKRYSDRLSKNTDQILRALLFVDETLLTAPVSGTSGFAEEFAKRGPADAAGRSLRQFDLRTRMFRFPCSYLVCSPAFAELPAPLKQAVGHQLAEILAQNTPEKPWSHLSVEDRQNIREILTETAPWLLP